MNADSVATWLLSALADFATHASVLMQVAVDDQDLLERAAEGVMSLRGWIRQLSRAKRHSRPLTAAITASGCCESSSSFDGNLRSLFLRRGGNFCGGSRLLF